MVDPAPTPAVSVFASPHSYEIQAVAQALQEGGVRSISAWGWAVQRAGVVLSAGARYDQMVHVLVSPELAEQAREILSHLPLVSEREAPTRISQGEVRRGQRTLAWVAGLVLISVIALIALEGTAVQMAFRGWLSSLFR